MQNRTEHSGVRLPRQVHSEPSGGAAAMSTRKWMAIDMSGDKVADLEREGDIAADYLEELLDIADLDGDIDMDVEGGRAMVAIVGGDLSALVGEDGEVLDALQELTRLAVTRETGDRSRLMLDVAGYRADRRATLTELGAEAAAKAKSSGEAVRLEPMTAFERKVVHDAVADAGLISESEGQDPRRFVVVLPPAAGDTDAVEVEETAQQPEVQVESEATEEVVGEAGAVATRDDEAVDDVEDSVESAERSGEGTSNAAE